MTSYPEPTGARPFDEMIGALPPVYPDVTLQSQIRSRIAASGARVAVLDDDPTGPQAVADVYVVTEWSVEALARELLEPRGLFFVLTNTRSLATSEAVSLHQQIAANMAIASRQTGVPSSLVSRGDSTLRGHFPEEVEALGEFDKIVLAPAFFEGGRYTIDDCQWVLESEVLMPAAHTPYARDMAFGYRSSNLRNWVNEKSKGRYSADAVDAIGLQEMRSAGPAAVLHHLLSSRRQITISNAAAYADLEVLTLGLMSAQEQGLRILVRSAASFVRTRAGNPQPTSDLASAIGARLRAGLVLVGSHVPKSTAQLEHLVSSLMPDAIELRVDEIGEGNRNAEVRRAATRVNAALGAGNTIVVYTTRELPNLSPSDSLRLGRAITEAFVEIVRSLDTSPGFVVAKGGWTGSEIGTKGFGVRRAYAPRPILPGIPMWLLGDDTLFPGMPYVLFPGNVGDADTLTKVVRLLSAA